MEYLQVFNKNKEKINERVSRENKLKLPDDKYFMIVLIFMENSDGEFLLQKTSKDRNSIIATTGGHVTYGDDGFKTAIKEVKEELGLDLDKKELTYIDTLTYRKAFQEIYYVCKDIDITSLTLQKEEVECVKWYTVDEIRKLIENDEFRKGNIEAFEKVLKLKDVK